MVTGQLPAAPRRSEGALGLVGRQPVPAASATVPPSASRRARGSELTSIPRKAWSPSRPVVVLAVGEHAFLGTVWRGPEGQHRAGGRHPEALKAGRGREKGKEGMTDTETPARGGPWSCFLPSASSASRFSPGGRMPGSEDGK